MGASGRALLRQASRGGLSTTKSSDGTDGSSRREARSTAGSRSSREQRRSSFRDAVTPVRSPPRGADRSVCQKSGKLHVEFDDVAAAGATSEPPRLRGAASAGEALGWQVRVERARLSRQGTRGRLARGLSARWGGGSSTALATSSPL